MDRPLDVPHGASRHQEHPLKADPSAQLKLLDLQELDARADQLRHLRSHLPELAEIADLTTQRKQLDDQARDARIVVDDLQAEQAKVDADVEQVKARRTRDRDRMDQGLITNPKDLERMGHELTSLERRIASLEDDELEVMERLEQAQATLDSLTAQVETIDTRLATLTEARDEKAGVIDTQLVDVEAQRGPSVEGLPEDLLALYEKLRAQKGGVGAARLHQRRCTGCQLGIDNAEIAVIRSTPADTVVRCEECSRILVRTAESGL
ncbi:zinc ribbon domain-containing protein [Nocardioides sp. Leaf374]|uniref:zinc ribbon domain-containing protein n=1 Tax=Nocardioides sp. Leaf374 TaxID=2876560 RepID=UPI001E462A6D|nr:C4-type zinc ribbon domain-containing protein [Nocardioides sp. Leaf374]